MSELKTLKLLKNKLIIENVEEYNSFGWKKNDFILDINYIRDIIEINDEYLFQLYRYFVNLLNICLLIISVILWIYTDIINFSSMFIFINLYLSIFATIVTYIAEPAEKIIYCCDKFYVVRYFGYIRTGSIFELYTYKNSAVELRNCLEIINIYIYSNFKN